MSASNMPRRAWTVVPLDERALTIRSYEDGDDMDAAFIVSDIAPKIKNAAYERGYLKGVLHSTAAVTMAYALQKVRARRQWSANQLAKLADTFRGGGRR